MALNVKASRPPSRQVLVALGLAVVCVLGVAIYRVAAATDSGCGAFASEGFNRPRSVNIVLLDNRFRRCRQLTHDGKSVEPTISPDGRRVAFISGRGYPVDEEVGFTFQSAYVMSIDGSDQRRLATNSAMRPIVWSPDGRRVAYNTTPERVSIVDVDTGRRTELPFTSPCAVARWADNSNLALNCFPGDGRAVIESTSVRGGDRRVIMTLPTGTSVWAPPYVVILPDHRRANRLLVRDLRTQRTHVVTGSIVPNDAASYSAVAFTTSDGRLGWIRHEYMGTYDLYISDLEGGPPRLLARQHGGAVPGFPFSGYSDNPSR